MLKIDRIGVNFHMLKGGARTRLVDGRGDVFFSWGAISDRASKRLPRARGRMGQRLARAGGGVFALFRRPAVGGCTD